MIIENKLREKAKKLLSELDLIIGYAPGSDQLKVSPVFIEAADDTEKMIFNKFCINNLATYSYFLSNQIKGKFGIILKPCDIKSIIQLISEGLLVRDRINIIAVGCSGIIDYKKIAKEIPGAKITYAGIENGNLIINTSDKTFELKPENFYADKCYTCKIYDKPIIYDEFIENDKKPDILLREEYEDIDNFEKLNSNEINNYWDIQFSRCIRCYACRNICPLEICKDKCISQLDEPHWQSQKINSTEGKFFQLIRVMHLAGRCTECGECERVCPMNIPVLKLMKKVNKEINRLFNFKPGISIDDKPPLLTFKNIEKNIDEEKLI
ncbi:MAG: 4Fe-4S dicluster domain-containing protein [Actinobacteria bacterium]|nr:4Fe-4S dicluster domain-containing protein [Actinomycetota bacterium]MCL6087757.1 4Fe-4S dicluster domain-containing protein [Actinomycetota bacterium]